MYIFFCYIDVATNLQIYTFYTLHDIILSKLWQIVFVFLLSFYSVILYYKYESFVKNIVFAKQLEMLLQNLYTPISLANLECNSDIFIFQVY